MPSVVERSILVNLYRISMLEDPHEHGGRQLCILIKGKTGEDTNGA